MTETQEEADYKKFIKAHDMGYDDTIVGNGLHKLITGTIKNYKEKYNAYSIIPSVIINKYKQCNFWEEI